ncbi:hypothetical protein WMY93_008747 [Mugilogobius chulae]|uniref:Uncharacterized protein n=1 Tax=Mugilogobius chulae TaxID=88201 RepID=A0AAW0PJW8_9GOBI
MWGRNLVRPVSVDRLKTRLQTGTGPGQETVINLVRPVSVGPAKDQAPDRDRTRAGDGYVKPRDRQPDVGQKSGPTGVCGPAKDQAPDRDRTRAGDGYVSPDRAA